MPNVKIMMSRTASLLGIPPELRLHIYEFLFARSELQKQNHCCFCPTGEQEEHDPDPRNRPSPFIVSEGWRTRTRCLCHGSLEPQVLRVCKDVYHEVIPLIYKNVEIWASLPLWLDDDLSNMEALTEIPASIRERVSNVLFVTSIMEVPVSLGIYEPRRDHLSTYWTSFDKLFPNIKSARLHFELVKMDFDENGMDYEPFASLWGLSRLRQVHIDLARCPAIAELELDDNPHFESGQIRTLARKMLEVLDRKEDQGVARKDARRVTQTVVDSED